MNGPKPSLNDSRLNFHLLRYLQKIIHPLMLSNILMHNVSVFFTKGHNCFATHEVGSFLKKSAQIVDLTR